MNKLQKCFLILLALFALVWSNQNAFAQNNRATTGREEYTGNIISFNGPQIATGFFTLRLNGRTSDEQSRQYLGVLKDRGQSEALDAIRDNDLGSVSIGNNLARTLNVVRESTVDGRRRIFIVFERWTQFAEHRFGTRSLDYPFGVIEIYVDPKTGKGEGTYIAAARIRLDDDRGTNQQQLEIENFSTYPARLNNITMTKGGKS